MNELRFGQKLLEAYNCDVWDKSAVHDVHMNPVSSSCLNGLYLKQHRSGLSQSQVQEEPCVVCCLHRQGQCVQRGNAVEESQKAAREDKFCRGKGKC